MLCCNVNETKTLWADIENTLDLMFQEDTIQDNLERYHDLNVPYGSDDFHSRDYHNQEFAIEDDYSFCLDFNKYLPLWIDSVNKESCCSCYPMHLRANDKCLCFNYTDTLEKVYKIPKEQILYIHGCWNDKNLVIGHNTPCIPYKQTEDDLYEDIAGITTFHLMQEHVYKNVEKRIMNHKAFFNSLTTIDTICILGLSLSEIDMPYLYEIKKMTPNDTKWLISYYDNNDYLMKKNKINTSEFSNFKLLTIDEIFNHLHNN